VEKKRKKRLLPLLLLYRRREGGRKKRVPAIIAGIQSPTSRYSTRIKKKERGGEASVYLGFEGEEREKVGLA